MLAAQDIPAEKVLKELGDNYRMLQMFVDPEDCGHGGVARPRTYIYYYYWRKLDYVYDVFDLHDAICKRIQKAVQTTPKDYLIPASLARDVDEMDIARKRQKTFHQEPSL